MRDVSVIGVALLLVGLMGYAIQRGATCTVAAVSEFIADHKFRRLWAMIEASIWVLGGLLLGNALGLPGLMPSGYRITVWTVAGAALLGVGAALNKACVFGAVARFGNGDWSYLATPVGFYLGCLLSQSPVFSAMAVRITTPSIVLAAPAWFAIAIGLWMIYRAVMPLLRRWRDPKRLIAGVWAPHAATLVIGLTFVVLMWLVGPWAYTDLLAELARGGMPGIGLRAALLMALLAGSVLGGRTASSFRPTSVTLRGVARSLLGGLMMGVGSLAIPGGNDGLILTGLPLLWPHAWIAFATMCISIGLYLSLEAFIGRRLKPAPT
jgi:toxin CptA